MNKFISILIVLLLGPFFFLNFLTLTIKQSAGKDFLKKELVKLNAYELAFTKMPELMSAAEGAQGETAIPAAETENIIKQFLTPKDFQEIVEATIDGSGDPQSINAEVNKKINEKVGAAFAPQMAALPVCSGGAETLCRPEGADFDATLKQLAASGNLTGTPLDTVVAAGTPKETVKSSPALFGLSLKNLSFLKYASWATLAVIMILVVLLSRLFAGSWKGTLIPLGVYFLLYAGVSFLNGILLLNFAVPIFTSFFPWGGTLKTDLLIPFFRDASTIVSRALNYNLFLMSILAVVFIIVGIVIRIVTKPKVAQVAENSSTDKKSA